jgi:hypothetical protein
MGAVAGALPQRWPLSKEWLFVSAVSSDGVALGGAVGQGWWLVAEEDDGPGQIVAGPYRDRADARWAAAREHGGLDDVRPVYGVRRADGALGRRPSPQDWSWLAHLGDQLDRLLADWDTTMSDDDPLTTLVVEVAGALSEAGLTLHDANGPASEIGGACLTPEPALGGIVVTWRQHDRMSVDQIHGAAADALVQQVMNRTLAEVLTLRGFAAEPFGGASGHVVRRAA